MSTSNQCPACIFHNITWFVCWFNVKVKRNFDGIWHSFMISWTMWYFNFNVLAICSLLLLKANCVLCSTMRSNSPYTILSWYFVVCDGDVTFVSWEHNKKSLKKVKQILRNAKMISKIIISCQVLVPEPVPAINSICIITFSLDNNHVWVTLFYKVNLFLHCTLLASDHIIRQMYHAFLIVIWIFFQKKQDCVKITCPCSGPLSHWNALGYLNMPSFL